MAVMSWHDGAPIALAVVTFLFVGCVVILAAEVAYHWLKELFRKRP